MIYSNFTFEMVILKVFLKFRFCKVPSLQVIKQTLKNNSTYK